VVLAGFGGDKMNKKILNIILITALVSSLAVAIPTSYLFGCENAVPYFQTGYEAGLTDMQSALDSNGVYTNWNLNSDGSYTITMLGANGAILSQTDYKLDLFVQQIRDGKVISQSIHAMSWTTAGLDWLADKIWNSGGTNVTQYAMYIGASAETDVFSAAWTALPVEVTTGGLSRAVASWTDSGTGTGNLTKTFSISDTVSSQLYGLYSNTYADASTSTLVAAEQQGSGAVKNMVSGDSLAITIMCSAAGA
jgi:hypothetical protein